MKNIDIINKIVSEKNGLDEKVVKQINQYYWKSIRSKMVNAEVSNIAVKGLCIFHVSKYNLHKHIYEEIYKIRKTKSSPFYKETTREKVLEKRLGRLRGLLRVRNEIANAQYDKGVRLGYYPSMEE